MPSKIEDDYCLLVENMGNIYDAYTHIYIGTKNLLKYFEIGHHTDELRESGAIIILFLQGTIL